MIIFKYNNDYFGPFENTQQVIDCIKQKDPDKKTIVSGNLITVIEETIDTNTVGFGLPKLKEIKKITVLSLKSPQDY
jgi:hypothetical protein